MRYLGAIGVIPAAPVKHERIITVVSAYLLNFAHIDGVVAVNVGTDDIAVEENRGAVENGDTIFRFRETVIHAARAVLGFLGKIGPDFFLLFREEVDTEALPLLQIPVGVSAVRDAN